MKSICFLSDGPNSHTQKYLSYFKDRGYELYVISLNGGSMDGVKFFDLGSNVEEIKNKSIFKKVSYLSKIKMAKKIIREIKPDILHAQYASSYGFIGSLVDHHPFIISVWGSDIYDFPNNGFIQNRIIKHNFKKADYIFANSRDMAKESNKYTDKNIEVTFLGVDIDKFKPMDVDKRDGFTIGIIKSLEKKYGIEYLIKAFKMLKDEYKNRKFNLRIGGSGSQLNNLKALVKSLGISDDVEFLGRVAFEDVPRTYNTFDLSVFPSIREGFGVASIESQACGVPVIVTNVGGHPESLIDGETGILVEPENPVAIKSALIKLLDDDYRLKLGKNGRSFIIDTYELKYTFKHVERLYESILNNC